MRDVGWCHLALVAVIAFTFGPRFGPYAASKWTEHPKKKYLWFWPRERTAISVIFPCHHKFKAYMGAYIATAEIDSQRGAVRVGNRELRPNFSSVTLLTTEGERKGITRDVFSSWTGERPRWTIWAGEAWIKLKS